MVNAHNLSRLNGMAMMVILAVIISTTLGSNGCLWTGNADNGNGGTGSSDYEYLN